eukprot:6800848-Prymnesium_polylepis.4
MQAVWCQGQCRQAAFNRARHAVSLPAKPSPAARAMRHPNVDPDRVNVPRRGRLCTQRTSGCPRQGSEARQRNPRSRPRPP